MKRLTAFFVFCLMVLMACADVYAGAMLSGPTNEREAFPYRNQDPRLGVIVNEGTACLNIYIYDEANRLIEQVYFSGANQWVTINSQTIPRFWVRRFEVGRYRMEIFPFYYQTDLAGPLVGQSARYRVDLPRQTLWFVVNRDPTDVWYMGRHWGWVIYLNCGNVSETAGPLPGVKVNFWGDFRR